MLKSLELQSDEDFEVIIADDGSKEGVKIQIEDLIQRSHLNISHVWHSDTGWNKNTILNKAIRSSNSSYIIFVDGDCLLHRKFVVHHKKYAKVGTILTGRRVNLSSRVSKKLNFNRLNKGYLGIKILIDSLKDVLSKETRDLEQGIYVGSTKIGDWLNRKQKGVLGSNFSVFKSDLMKVNGFDERFTEPAAGEDTDLQNRLKRIGLKVKTVRNRAIQYHLYHKELTRTDSRLKYLTENDQNNISYTPYGIIKKE